MLPVFLLIRATFPTGNDGADCRQHRLFHPPDPDAPVAHLKQITPQPTLVVNGVNTVMIASIRSWRMIQNIPNAQLIVYPDAGHGAQFQYPDRFMKHAIQFLDE